jgi:hypothetical protein
MEVSIRRLMADWGAPDALPLLLQSIEADGLGPTARGLGVKAATLREAVARISQAGDARKPLRPQT